MDDIVSKHELLSRIAKGYERLASVIDQFTPLQMAAVGLYGRWSIRDFLAHIVAHEQRAIDEVETAQKGSQLFIDHSANHSFNDGAVFANRPFDGPTVRVAWHRSYENVLQRVAALPDEEFMPSSLTVRTLNDSVDGALANNTYLHYSEHLDAVEKWLRTVRSGSK